MSASTLRTLPPYRITVETAVTGGTPPAWDMELWVEPLYGPPGLLLKVDPGVFTMVPQPLESERG